MDFPFSLCGKSVLVTGASSGIGRAIAVACADMGGEVWITGRNETRLQETLARLRGDGHRAQKADLTCENDRKSLVETLPALDGVVHCAGAGSRVLCKHLTEKDIMQLMSVNFIAPALLQASLLSQRKIKKAASVVFISSRAPQAPSAGNAAYSASKGAVQAYARVLALESASRSVRVNCICPAMVWTELIEKSGLDREEMEALRAKYPLKRLGTPEDIAFLAVYLLSDASSWMTGSSLDITGGGEGLLTL